MNYLDIENPVGLPRNKHLDRLDGVGDRRELHVGYSDRLPNFDSANLVALLHIKMVNTWLAKHQNMIVRKYSDQASR
jgi:hypothetical protein